MIARVEDKTVFGKTINLIYANVLSYDLQHEDCKMRYELRYRNPERESPAIVDDNIANGMWQVPTDVLSAWTGSNAHLVKAMCEDFEFQFIEILAT
jgi:hypothetical protein